MASPQKENGYTAIANDIVETLSKMNLSPYESRVLWCLFRQTYGWNRASHRISLSQFTKATGIDRRKVHRALKSLSSRKVIAVTSTGDRMPSTYRFQKNYDLWALSPLRGTGTPTVPSTGDKSVPSTGTLQNNIKKKDSAVDTVRTKKSPKKKAPNPDIRRFFDWWVLEYPKRTGVQYQISGGKEGALVRSMLKTFGYERIVQMATLFLDMKDPFIEKAGRTIAVFHSQANKIAIKIQDGPTLRFIPSEEFIAKEMECLGIQKQNKSS